MKQQEQIKMPGRAGYAGKIRFRTGNFIKQLVLALWALIILYPLFFVLMSSLKTNNEVITSPFTFTSFHPQNYLEAWKVGQVGQFFLNSVIVTAVTLVLGLAVILFAGYALGKLKPPGHKIIMTVYLSTMFVTSEMTMIPVFMLCKRLGIYNTRWGLILPYIAGSIVLGIYITSNYISGIPKEMEEAAIVDGCGILQIMFRIDFPLIVPVISTILILNFQAVWGEFFWALICIKREAIKTLPLGLMNFQSQYSSNYATLSAGLTILTAPLVLVYIAASRYFIEGVTIGAVKG